jgi:glycosyltransferase involved in cell wall biosynthesis
VRDLLLRNGVDPAKITLCRQGLPYSPERATRPEQRPGSPLRIAFLGRFSPVKGLDTLVGAILSRPSLPIRLDVFGVAQDDEGRRMAQTLSESCLRDERIRFHAPVPASDVVRRLAEYDALAVPSRWLESGPLVVYEAFAAGIPVIGSKLGGIAELVRDGVNGLLVPAGSIEAWASVLESLASAPELLARLTSGVGQPRTMADAAREMDDVYRAAVKMRVCN